ncbi:hypothetical protein SEVIR_9G380100v4 [Setaria viridis]
MPAAEADSPTIRKLGRLFWITEVHLWDDSYAAGASDGQKHWRSAEAAPADFHADKPCNKASKDTDKGHSFVEDLELANLMGSLGLPVSFSTSKANKNTGNKGKKKGRQVQCEAGSTQIDDAVRICSNTEDRESDVQLMAVSEHTNSCNSSGYNESCHDTDKMLQEGRPYVEEQEESGCSTIYSAERGYEAENQCELGTSEPPDNLGNTAKAEYPIQENQAADSVFLESEMLRHDSVDGESARSCVSICQEERLSTKEDQLSVKTLSVPHDNNDFGLEACPSLAEQSSVDEHAESSASNFCYEYGDWTVVWDPFYSRYYFYNIQTQESTWYPPEGLEDFASYNSRDATIELVKLGSKHTSMAVQENNQVGDDKHLDAQEQDHCSELHYLSKIPDEEPIIHSMITTFHEGQYTKNKHNDSTTDVLEMDQDVASTKKKKRIIHAKTWQGTSPMISSSTGLSGTHFSLFLIVV